MRNDLEASGTRGRALPIGCRAGEETGDGEEEIPRRGGRVAKGIPEEDQHDLRGCGSLFCGIYEGRESTQSPGKRKMTKRAYFLTG